MARYSVNNYTVETLLSNIKSGSIAIPEMQRPFVWDSSKVRDLVDSLYKGFPVGYIIVWQNPDVKLKDGTKSSGKKILIDGQQRITAMAAAIVGQEVLDDHYKWKRISIAFNPVEEKFEVANNAILKSSKWIPDIAPVLEPAFDTFSFVMEYCQKNEITDQMSQVNNIVNRLRGMSDLEKYMNGEDSLDPLIQAALIHYQFETTHPFLDGNGRVGRLLITLFLMEKKILSAPSLYISYFLKMNRVEYYDRMTQVRKTGDYEQWVLFFLQALSDSAEDAIQAIDRLTEIHNRNVQKFNSMTKRQQTNAINFLIYLEKTPIIDIQKTATALNLSYNTVAKNVASFVDNGILQQTEKSGRAKIYSYVDYLAVLRKDT